MINKDGDNDKMIIRGWCWGDHQRGMIIRGVCDEKEVIRAIQGWAPPSSGSHSWTDTLSIIYLPQCWPRFIQIHIQVDSSWLKFTKTWEHCGYIQSQPSILILVQIKSTTSFLHLPSFWWFISTDNQKWNEVLMVKIIEVDLKTILLSFFLWSSSDAKIGSNADNATLAFGIALKIEPLPIADMIIRKMIIFLKLPHFWQRRRKWMYKAAIKVATIESSPHQYCLGL